MESSIYDVRHRCGRGVNTIVTMCDVGKLAKQGIVTLHLEYNVVSTVHNGQSLLNTVIGLILNRNILENNLISSV